MLYEFENVETSDIIAHCIVAVDYFKNYHLIKILNEDKLHDGVKEVILDFLHEYESENESGVYKVELSLINVPDYLNDVACEIIFNNEERIRIQE